MSSRLRGCGQLRLLPRSTGGARAQVSKQGLYLRRGRTTGDTPAAGGHLLSWEVSPHAWDSASLRLYGVRNMYRTVLYSVRTGMLQRAVIPVGSFLSVCTCTYRTMSGMPPTTLRYMYFMCYPRPYSVHTYRYSVLYVPIGPTDCTISRPRPLDRLSLPGSGPAVVPWSSRP